MQSFLFSEKSGQDLIEYSLMAAFVAAGAVAIVPGNAEAIISIISEKSVRVIAGFAMIAILIAIILRRKKMDEEG